MANVPKPRDAEPAAPPETDPQDPSYLHSEDEWDIVDQASWESFPASDPPSYVAGHDASPKRDRESAD